MLYKINSKSKIIITVICASLISMQANALILKEKSILPISVASGTAIGITSGLVAALLAKNYGPASLKNNNTNLGAMSGLAGFIAGSTLGLLINKVLKNYTPQAKYSKIIKQFNEEKNNQVLNISLGKPDEIIKSTEEIFHSGSNESLYKAGNTLDHSMANLYSLRIVANDIVECTDSSELKNKAEKLISRIDTLIVLASEINLYVSYATIFYNLQSITSNCLLVENIQSFSDLKKELILIYPRSHWPLLEAESSLNSLISRTEGTQRKLDYIISKTKSLDLKNQLNAFGQDILKVKELLRARKLLIYSDKEEFDRQYKRQQEYIEQQRREEEMRQRARQHEEEMRIEREKLAAAQKQNQLLLAQIVKPAPTTTLVINNSNQNNSADCSICLTANTDYRTTCGHTFHKSCLDAWKRTCTSQGRATTCPYCRNNI